MIPFTPPRPMAASMKMLQDLDWSEWILQPKMNGQRVLLWRDGDEFGAWSRYAAPFKGHGAAGCVKLAEQLPSGFVFDGEWCVADGYFAFDLLIDLPLSDRLDMVDDYVNLLRWPAMPRGKLEDYKSWGGEGVVAKRLDSLYEINQPETRDWLKRRFTWD